MALWIVRVTWNEDENEVSSAWEVNAASVEEAVSGVATRLRFQPHHVDARMAAPGSGEHLMPGEIRHLPEIARVG